MEHGTCVVVDGDTYIVLKIVPHTVARGNARGPVGASKVTMKPTDGTTADRVVISAPPHWTWVDSTRIDVAAPCETCGARLGFPCAGNVCLPRLPSVPTPTPVTATREQAHA